MKNLIMRISIIIFCSFLTIQLFSQVGLSVSFHQQQVDQWQEIIMAEYGSDSNENFLKNGAEVAFDYWWRFKNFRVEFLPTAFASRYQTTLVNPYITENTTSGKYYNFTGGAHLKINIYPLDFKGDCDCPTFKKDGNIIKKGFHVQLIGGGRSITNGYKMENIDEKFNMLIAEAGAGVGLDIGISEFFTVTPYFNYIHSFNPDWQNFEKLAATAAGVPTTEDITYVRTDMSRMVFGVRLGFRFDELNKYGYR